MDTWPSWSPDGKWIAFGRQVGTKRDIWMLEVASNKTFPITTSGNCIKPTWAWDSKAVYYSTATTERNEDIYVARDLTLKVPPTPSSGKSSRARPRPHSTPPRKTHK